MEQHHRIEAAGDREQDVIATMQSRPDSIFNLYCNAIFRHVGKIALGVRRQPSPSSQQPAAKLYCHRSVGSRVPGTLGACRLETHGPLGTLWVSIALGCFYIALIWLNTLLGFFLTPLFMIPVTWVTDALELRKQDARQEAKQDAKQDSTSA
jgi:hypothetical protein